jgi:hypothetical protein
MGFVGFILYELALLTGMIMTFRTYRRYIRGGNVAAANYAAMAVAAQVVLFITEIDADHHSAFAALFFWFALFIGSGFSAPSGLRVPSNRKREAIVLTPSRA